MKKITKISILGLILVQNAIASIDITGEIRPRYEAVESGVNSFTTRSKLSLDYNELENIKMGLVGFNVSNFEIEQKVDYSRVAEAYIDYRFDDTKIVLGRQKLQLDNGRFLAISNWKQAYKTHDGLLLENESINDLTLTAFYSDKMYKDGYNDCENNSLWLNAKYQLNKDNTATLYRYSIDGYDTTIGSNFKGKYENLKYYFEYAAQGNLTYFNVRNSVSYKEFEFGLDYAEQENGFVFPYGSSHGYNGFNDGKFTKTDINTFEVYSSIKLFNNKSSFKTSYYSFKQNDNGANLGNEIDISFKYKVNNNIDLALFSSHYYKDENNNQNKYWFQLEYKF